MAEAQPSGWTRVFTRTRRYECLAEVRAGGEVRVGAAAVG